MSSARHRGEVVGFQREEETPEQVIRGTTPEGLAQVEGWILDVVRVFAGKAGYASPFKVIRWATSIQPCLLGPLLARLVDRGALIWADDGGYLPA